MPKRLIAWLLALLMIVCQLPVAASDGAPSDTGDDTVVEYSDPVQLPWMDPSRQKPAAAYLMGDTPLGILIYSALYGTYLPQGERPTAGAVDPALAQAAADARTAEDRKRSWRVLGAFSLGLTDEAWQLDGSVHVTYSLNELWQALPNEKLVLVRLADGQTVKANFSASRIGLRAFSFTADAMGDYAVLAGGDAQTVDYTVTFVGADGTVLETRVIEAGQPVGAFPEAPAREGWTFAGWVSGDGEPVDETTPVTADLTMIASYMQDYLATVADAATDTLNVHVEVPEGALPADARFRMAPVNSEDYRNAVETALGGQVGEIQAVDMTFVGADGTEYQPLRPVTVQVTLTGMADAASLSVVHIRANGQAEIVYTGAPETVKMRGGEDRKTFSFQADGFSVYAVVEAGEPASRMTLNFYGKDLTTPLATMYVKNEDDLEQATKILFDPGAGALDDGEIFRGWVIGDIAHDGESVTMPEYNVRMASTEGALKTIEDIRAWAAAFDDESEENYITEGDVVNIRAAIYKIYVVTYLDSQDIAQSADSVLIMPDDDSAYYEYTISQDYTPVKDTVRFEGWVPANGTESNITTDTQQADHLYQKDDVIHITDDVDFKVQQSEGHWIVFHENGKGGTYKAPQFVITGDNTVDPGAMERKGYTFDGWYTAVSGPTDDHGYTPVAGSRFTFGDDLDDFGDGKLHLYAKWTPVRTAPYTVVFWGEKIGEDGKVAHGQYEVLGSYVNNNGQVGQPIPYTSVNNGDEDYATGVGNNNGHYTGFNLTEASKGQQVTITPEGDAVLNLYYDRIHYDFKFYIYRDRGGNNNRYSFPYNSAGGSELDTLVSWGERTTTWSNNHPDADYPLYHETYNNNEYYYFVLSAFYGEDISSSWPTYSKITGADNRDPVSFVMMVGTKLKPRPSSGGDGTVKGLVSVMDENILGATNDSKGNYVMVRFPGSYYNWRYHIWYETIPGVDYSDKTTHTWNGVTYYEDTVLTVRSSNTTVTNQNAPKYQGFDFIDWRGENWNNRNYWNTYNPTLYHINEVYSRQQFTITYFDGNYVDGNGKTIQNRASQQLHESPEIPQGAVIPDEYRNYVPDAPELGYKFEGWYLDEGCTVPYTWGTMPVGPENHSSAIKVYAKWQQIEYRVFLHSGVPQGEEFTWGSDDQAMNFRVSYGGRVSLPTGRDREGWEFLGWYTTPNYRPSSRFTTDYALTDSNTVAYNKETDLTDEMDKWGYIVGEGTNADLDRPWITKKLDLYAKWHRVLEGADGINVVYDAVLAGEGVEPPTGHNPPTDSTYYIDTAMATAQAGSSADDPTEYQFECWVVQKWNGTRYVDTDVEVYPGDTFEVLKMDAKEEDYTDPSNPKITKKYTIQLRAKYKPVEDPTPTHIDWYKNYEENGKHEAFHQDPEKQINESVPIQPRQTREGYSFIGWARVETDDSHSHVPEGGTVPVADVLPLGPNQVYIKWENGKFWAKNKSNEWVVVTEVAADEATPYHDMYAVWVKDYPIKVQKNWDNVGAFGDYIPQTVTVEVLKNGTSMSPAVTITLTKNADGTWPVVESTQEFPAFDENGNENHYTVVERAIDGWELKNTEYGKIDNVDPGYVNQNNFETPVKVTNTRVNGSITLNKTISGIPDALISELNNVQFYVEGPRQENNTYKNTYGPYKLTDFTLSNGVYTLVHEDLAFVEPGAYIYYEGDANLLTDWGYELIAAAGTTESSPVNITLSKGSTVTGAIANAYDRVVGDLVINKTVAGDPLPTAYASGKFPYTVKLKNNRDWWLKGTGTPSDKYDLTPVEAEAGTYEITSAGSLRLEDIPIGTYTVYEQGTEENGSAWIEQYELTVTYTTNPVVVPKDTTGQTGTIGITNTYIKQVGTLSVSKVTDPNSISQGYKFTVRNSANKYLYPVNSSTTPVTYGFRDTAYEFTATSNGNAVLFVDIPVDTYTVAEVIDGTIEGDRVNVQVEDYRYNNTVYSATDGSIVVLKTHTEAAPAAVTITNSYTKLVDVTLSKTFKDIQETAIPTGDSGFNITYIITENDHEDVTGERKIVTSGDNVPTVDTSVEGQITYTWTIPDVPVGATVTATENGYAATGYRVTPDEQTTRTCTAVDSTYSSANKIAFNNEYDLGTLTITKTANGLKTGDTVPEGTTFTVKKSDGTTYTMFTYAQMENDSITLMDVPIDETYSVVESGADVLGYNLSTTYNADAALSSTYMDGTIEVINTYSQATLTLTKRVTGNYAEDRDFAFMLTVAGAGADESFSYTKSNGDSGTIASGRQFRLYADERIIITLPVNKLITLEELDNENYNVTWQGMAQDASNKSKATITLTGDATATVTNVRKLGRLTINKQVVDTSAAPETTKTFAYTVQLSEPVPEDAVLPQGVSRNNDGYELTFNLGNNGSVTIENLPVGATYTVAETDDPASAYTKAVSGDETAAIIEGEKTVSYTNTRKVGYLKIIKQAVGQNGDPIPEADDEDYTFTITFGNPTTQYGNNVTVKGNNEEGVTIANVPYGNYIVTELTGDNDADVQITGYRYDGNNGPDNVNVSEYSTEESPTVSTITNSYTKLVDVTLSKTFKGIPESLIPTGDNGFTIEYTITETGHDNVTGVRKIVTTGDNVPTKDTATAGQITYTWTIPDVPVGATVSATESGYTVTGYKVTPDKETGTCTAADSTDSNANKIAFENVYEQGSLTIKKSASGLVGDDVVPADATFTVKVGEETYKTVKYSDMTNGSITLTGVPIDATYSVVESGAEVSGYKLETSVSDPATLDSGHMTGEITVTNTYSQGSLSVKKTVVSDASADHQVPFTFTVVLGEPVAADWAMSGVTVSTDRKTLTFELISNQTINLEHLPADASYTVSETAVTGFTSDGGDGKKSGTIPQAGVLTTFTNTRDTDSLTVSKNVASDRPDDKAATTLYHFTITLSDTSITKEYSGVSFVEGVAEIDLAHDQNKVIEGLPTGITATVEETAVADMTTTYQVGTASGQGTKAANVAIGSTVAFTNTRDEVEVTLQKLVEGNMGNRDEAFTFSAVLTDAVGTAITGFDNGTIVTDNSGKVSRKDGLTISLKHNETFNFGDLPVGAILEISETNGEAYITSQEENPDWKTVESNKTYPLVIPSSTSSSTCIVKFKNYRNVEIDTGIYDDTSPYLLLLGLIPLAGVGVILGQRRRRRRIA